MKKAKVPVSDKSSVPRMPDLSGKKRTNLGISHR